MRYENHVISKNIERKQKINKLFLIIVYILLIPTILFSLLLITLELGNSVELPSFLNVELYTVVSESMMPRLHVDDIIIVKKGYKLENYKQGNIITFKREDGEIITHRIYETTLTDGQRTFITKGDNNDTIDEEKVTKDNIIGKVIYTMPRFGNIVKFLKNKLHFSCLIILLILIVLFDNWQRKKKILRKIDREKHEKKAGFYF